jgi:capsular polysaccharide biosynthesis protein
MEGATSLWWSHQEFPLIPDSDLDARWVDGAIVSRADSGSINWNVQAPRSYVRGAVYTDRGEIVDASQRAGGTGGDLVATVNPRHLTAEELKEAAGHRVHGPWLYAGSWMHGFGHFIVETLPTLWPLLADDQQADAARGIVAHRFTSRRRHAWQDALVRPLIGDREIRVVDATPASYERLLVPARPYLYESAISPRAADVWDCVARRIAPQRPSHSARIYLSRTRFVDTLPADAPARSRAYANAATVDELFRQRGFAIVYPEDLSVADQVALVRDAEIVAGPSGSALHLAAFMRSGRVIELGDSRTATNLVVTQRAIAAVKGQLIVHIPFVEGGTECVDIDYLSGVLDML